MLPKVISFIFFSLAKLISSSEKPPSGPISMHRELLVKSSFFNLFSVRRLAMIFSSSLFKIKLEKVVTGLILGKKNWFW